MTPGGSTLSTDVCLAAIERHSRGLAQAARDDLEAAVEHCPGWSVADLVWHLTEVHWFWATIAEERLDSPPDGSRRPSRPSDGELVDSFEAGARRLVAVLRHADQGAPCWTWAPAQQDVAFITRHQVQEAAVHHWDAADAAGRRLEIEPDAAADAVEEFLTFSVSTDADPATAAYDRPMPLPLTSTFALCATDAARSWTVTDGSTPSTVSFTRGHGDGVPAIRATASDLLLWLYDRVAVEPGDVPRQALERFRGLRYTD